MKKIVENNKSQDDRFFELSIDLMCVANTDGTFRKVNLAFSTLLGYSKEELEGQLFTNFIHEEDLPSTLEVVDKLAKGVLLIDFYNRYRAKNGDYRLLQWHAAPDVETGMLYAMARDVTEKQEDLKNFEDLKYALDQSSIVAMTDQKGEINFVNDKFCEISKFSRQELIGQDHRIVNSGFHSKEFMKELWSTIANGDVWKGEVKNKAKDGTYYWVDTTIVPFINEKGKPFQYVAIRADITDKKNQELHLSQVLEMQKAILNGTDYAIISTTVDGIITSFNKGAEKIVGYTAGELVGKESPAIFHDLNEVVSRAAALTEELGKTIEPGFDTFVVKAREMNEADENNWTYVHKNGKRTPVTLSITALKDSSNNLFGYLGVAKDINVEKAYLEKITKQNKQLDQFAYVVSHDLKAPLRAINTLAEFLEEDLEDKLDDNTRKNFILLKNRASRMQRLITDILEYSKIGKEKLATIDVDLNILLKEIVSGLIYPDSFSITIPDNIPSIRAKRVFLYQIFSNLISNAIKYNDKENGSLDIKFKESSKSMEFSFTDNGPGIDPLYHAKIFDVFQTIDAKDDVDSTGIGLSTVKKIIEEMDGNIQVKSEIGDGSTFIVTLPIL